MTTIPEDVMQTAEEAYTASLHYSMAGNADYLKHVGLAILNKRAVIVGWMYEDELPENYPYDAMFPFSKVDGVRMFPVFAPNATEDHHHD